MNDDTDIMWCHDKLIHWLPESDVIELTDKFQLVSNFHSIWNIKSAVNKVTHSKTFLSHNVILYSSSRRTLKFTFNQTLLSRDFSILFRLSKLSISQRENSLPTKACEAATAKFVPTDQQPKLRADCMLLDNSRIPEACLPSSDWFEYQQSSLFVDYPYLCGWRGCISWLVVNAFKNVVGISYWDNFSYSYS